MPTISMLYGILVAMHFEEGERHACRTFMCATPVTRRLPRLPMAQCW
jgi:hypothetical protein